MPGCPNSVKFDGLVVPRRSHSHVHVNIFVSLSNRRVSKRRPRTSPRRLAQRSSHAAIFSPASSGRADWPTQLWSSGHDVRVSPQVGLGPGQEVWSKAGVSSLESVGEESGGEGAGLPVAFQLVSTPTASLSPDSKLDSKNMKAFQNFCIYGLHVPAVSFFFVLSSRRTLAKHRVAAATVAVHL